MYGKQIWTWVERDENRFQAEQITEHITKRKVLFPWI
jgi:hypothetical protein